jgi:hypothetical protein
MLRGQMLLLVGLHNLLNEGLYCWDVTQPLSRSLTWGAESGVEGTIQRAVDAAVQKFNPIPESFHIALQIAAQRGHVPISWKFMASTQTLGASCKLLPSSRFPKGP